MHKHSGIRDNHQRGKVADFLADRISAGSQLSVVSAYFTIYAYEALSQNLDTIGSLRFLVRFASFLANPDSSSRSTRKKRTKRPSRLKMMASH